MVKALAFFKRKAGMPVDEFQAYWLTRHPEAVTHLAGLRRYVQSHTLPTAYHKGEPVYDGIAEVWFDDTARCTPCAARPRWTPWSPTRRASSTARPWG